MNDRLGDIGALADEDATENEDFENEAGAGGGRPSNGQQRGGDVEMAECARQPTHMDHFFREVETIKDDIEFIKAAARLLLEHSEAAVQATTSEEETDISRQVRPLIDGTNKRAKRSKTLLGLLKEESQKLKSNGKINSSDLRIRENLCNTLTRKFIDEMKNYQNSQTKYKNDVKKKVTRQVQIVKPDATDEEIDAVMRTEGGRDALYREQVLAGGVNDQVQTAYNKVAGKYQDVLAIEQSVAELHQMFLDMALLTEQQGELLDQIEHQVKEAADYTEEGNVDLVESIEYQKKIRKKQLWILLIVVAAIVVILFASGII